MWEAEKGPGERTSDSSPPESEHQLKRRRLMRLGVKWPLAGAVLAYAMLIPLKTADTLELADALPAYLTWPRIALGPFMGFSLLASFFVLPALFGQRWPRVLAALCALYAAIILLCELFA